MKGRPLAILFLLLLLVAFVQVGWWILDETRYTAEVTAALAARYAADRTAAARLLARGASPATVTHLFPHLTVAADGRTVRVRRETLRALRRARARRLRRFGWEGLFFLAVLGAGMVVLYRTLRQQARLRRREANFLAAVTHELKSPLTSLRLGVEGLQLIADPEPRRQRVLGRMEGDLARLEGLVTNVLEAARLDRGRARARPESVAVAEVVREVLTGLEPRRAARGTAVSVEVPPALRVFADREAFRTVVRNLVDNALKFVPAGEGQVRIRAAAAGEWVHLSVTDNGVGFPPTEAPRLFEKFYRPGEELTRRAPGTGLGLYLVRRLSEGAGGRVAASSPGPGRGARFEVWWPRAERTAPHDVPAHSHR